MALAERLDIVHAHYAIPHAAAAYLARQVLASSPEPRAARDHDAAWHGYHAARLRPLVLGNRRLRHRGVRRRDTVSESLKNDTYRELGCTCDIRVIPNFIDCEKNRRRDVQDFRRSLAPHGEKLFIHVSNFRPVKRVEAVVEVFARVAAKSGASPDGRRRPGSRRRRVSRRRSGSPPRSFLGEQDLVVPLLSVSDVFLLPSAQESFGLAALEAMACGVPVVAHA